MAGTAIKISGPKKAEPLVRLLAEHRAQVLDALRKMQEVQKVQGTESRGTSPERDPGPFASALAALRAKCPDYVPEDRWHQAIVDAARFISEWGAQAEAFGWTERELFGLPDVPERPRPSYQRLSRYDQTGLVWLLQGRRVVALAKEPALGSLFRSVRLSRSHWIQPQGKALSY
jgi:hypothetical protein